MTAGREYPWVALRFEYSRSGDLVVRWRDPSARRWSGLPSADRGDLLQPLRADLSRLAQQLVVPSALHDYRRSTLTDYAVAVFLDAPVQLRGLPLEDLADAAIGSAPTLSSVQNVRWAHRRSVPGRPFRLPLRVVAVGLEYVELRDRLRDAEWYASAPEVVDLGFQFELLDPSAVRARLAPGRLPIDVVVAPERELSRVLTAARRGDRPRLIACVGEPLSHPSWLSTLNVPAGCSLAWLPWRHTRSPSELAKDLIYEVIHDRPLHEAVWIANTRWDQATAPPARLISDPRANQSLRLSDAAGSLVHDVEALTSEADVGDVEAFLERLEADDRDRVAAPLRSAAQMARPLHEANESTWNLSVDFASESTGLKPLSQIRAAWRVAADVQPSVLHQLRIVTRDPAAVEVVRRHQKRVVDVALLRLEPTPMLASRGAASWLPIENDVVLRERTAYRVRVHIGTPSHGSLLTERPPSLDPLLPDPPDARGHLLEIVLYGHDFEALAGRRHERYLPVLGGVDPVYFDLRAPAIADDGEEIRPAQARVAVYYQGNLLQSFLLHALVAREEQRGHSGCLRVELEFSQSSRLANLEQIGPRPFSIAANATADGHHRLMFKSTGDDADVTLTADQIDNRIQRFRDTLLDATFSDQRNEVQRFQLATAPDWDEFDRYVRLLARDGGRLFQALYVSSAGLRSALRAIGQSSDQLIQVVLHNSRFGLPWAGVYDRRPPAADEPICLGGLSRQDIEAGAPLEFRCEHGYGSRAFCVFGFWGIRQRLEYRLAGGGDPVPSIDPAPRQRRVCLAVGDFDDFTKELADELVHELGSGRVKVLAQGEDPLDVLWSADRPAEIVLLGHLDDQPDDPRIVFLGNPKPLTNDDVFDRIRHGPWETPQSLVLLMACASAVSDLRSLVSMLETFTAAPAGAVVGTETPVVTSLVSRFASDLTMAMWRDDDKLSLGAAMTEVRRRLLQRGNPLAFAFSAYGNGDITIAS